MKYELHPRFQRPNFCRGRKVRVVENRGKRVETGAIALATTMKNPARLVSDVSKPVRDAVENSGYFAFMSAAVWQVDEFALRAAFAVPERAEKLPPCFRRLSFAAWLSNGDSIAARALSRFWNGLTGDMPFQVAEGKANTSRADADLSDSARGPRDVACIW